MNERKLRDALRAEVVGVAPSADAFARLERRLDRPGRSAQRRALAVAVAVVLVAALVAGVVAFTRDPSTRRSPAGPTAGGAPRRILTVTTGHQPVVIDTRTNRVLVRYESHSVAEGTQLAVAPDGRSFYFVDGEANKGCQNHSIVRFGLAPHVPGTVVADEASEPAVSRDGRWLAFYRCLPGDARADQLVVRDLRLGGERIFTPPTDGQFGERLLFDADSNHLIYEIAGPLTDLRRIDLFAENPMPGVPLGLAQRLAGTLESGTRYLVVGPHVENSKQQAGDLVASAGPNPAVPGQRSEPFDGWFWLPSDVTSASADSTTRHVVAVSQASLYRWSRGDRTPTKIRNGVTAAAWIPNPRPPDHPSLAVAQDGRLRIYLEPASEVVRDVTPLPPGSSISAVPNGDGVVIGDPSPGCAPPAQIQRVGLTDGTRSPVALGRYPAVSRSGLVAYEIRCDGVTLGTTDLASGANARSDPLGGVGSEGSARVQHVQPIAFSPDGTQLLYIVQARGRGGSYFVGRVRKSGLIGSVRRLPIDESTMLTFLDDRHLMAAYSRFPFTVVRRVALSVGRRGHVQIGATMLRFRGAVTHLSADPIGRSFLAVLRGGTIITWRRDGRQLGQVASRVDSATWLPPQSGG